MGLTLFVYIQSSPVPCSALHVVDTVCLYTVIVSHMLCPPCGRHCMSAYSHHQSHVTPSMWLTPPVYIQSSSVIFCIHAVESHRQSHATPSMWLTLSVYLQGGTKGCKSRLHSAWLRVPPLSRPLHLHLQSAAVHLTKGCHVRHRYRASHGH